MPLVETASALTTMFELKPTSYQVVCGRTGAVGGALIVMRMGWPPIPLLLNFAFTRSVAVPWKLVGMETGRLLTVAKPTGSELLRMGKVAFQCLPFTVALVTTEPGLVTVRFS